MLNRYLLIFLFRVSEEGSLLFGRDETTDPGAGPENTPRGFGLSSGADVNDGGIP